MTASLTSGAFGDGLFAAFGSKFPISMAIPVHPRELCVTKQVISRETPEGAKGGNQTAANKKTKRSVLKTHVGHCRDGRQPSADAQGDRTLFGKATVLFWNWTEECSPEGPCGFEPLHLRKAYGSAGGGWLDENELMVTKITELVQ